MWIDWPDGYLTNSQCVRIGLFLVLEKHIINGKEELLEPEQAPKSHIWALAMLLM